MGYTTEHPATVGVDIAAAFGSLFLGVLAAAAVAWLERAAVPWLSRRRSLAARRRAVRAAPDRVQRGD